MTERNKNKPLVIVTRKLPQSIETRMAALFDVRLNADDTPFTKDQLIAAVGAADVLVPTVTDVIDADVINAAGDRLQLIANFGAGVNHIDLNAAAARKLNVTNTPGVLTNDTADLAMSLLLSVPRRIFEGEKILRDGAWTGWAPTFLLGHRVTGKKLGIIGMGRIGRAVAKRAAAFDITVYYHNRTRLPADIEAELNVVYCPDLDEMLMDMDFVSVNCPLTDDTYHLLDHARMSKMQSHTIIINTARGEIIDEGALADLLEAGKLAGAGLDVFEGEPTINPKLLKLDNVVLVPHMGSGTQEGRVGMGDKVLINIQTYVDGHRPPDRVLL